MSAETVTCRVCGESIPVDWIFADPGIWHPDYETCERCADVARQHYFDVRIEENEPAEEPADIWEVER